MEEVDPINSIKELPMEQAYQVMAGNLVWLASEHNGEARVKLDQAAKLVAEVATRQVVEPNDFTDHREAELDEETLQARLQFVKGTVVKKGTQLRENQIAILEKLVRADGEPVSKSQLRMALPRPSRSVKGDNSQVDYLFNMIKTSPLSEAFHAEGKTNKRRYWFDFSDSDL